MKAFGSVAAVIAAIREDADAEVEAIERDAEKAIAALPRDPDAGSFRPEEAAAVSAARERARIGAAREDWEDARSALSEREEWLARALEIGRAQLAAAQPATVRRDDLARLAREGIDRLPAGPLEIVVSAADAPLLDREWRAALVDPADPGTIAVVTGAIAGGCLVRSADGRAVVDNTWPARAERLQSAWRSALADVYERAVSQLPPAPGDDRGR